MEIPTNIPSFYKRPLPSTCISFLSKEGKEIFGRALGEGNLECFFPLASQFLTQDEPAFCGLATLCLILNALERDPGQKWKGSWRWYSQKMLDCCRPLKEVEQVGITLSEFGCLARCNGLKARVVNSLASTTSEMIEAGGEGEEDEEGEEEGIEAFREDLRKVSRGEGMMALSYSRKSLLMTGSGHFSPIGGFSEIDDMVLILDVARFKYPSYWITVKDAWKAMKPLDTTTGLPRGYAILSILPESDPSSLSADLSETKLTLNKSTWSTLSSQISKTLLSSSKSSSTNGISILSSLHEQLQTLPLYPIISRKASATTTTSTDTLSILARRLSATELSKSIGPINLYFHLFILSIFDSPSSSFLSLLPPHLKEEIEVSLGPSLEIPEVKKEIEILGKQLRAMGECCREEEEGVGCGCSSVLK